MKTKNKFARLWPFLLLAACAGPAKNDGAGYQGKYFDLKGFVGSQVEMLKKTDCRLEKNLRMGEKTDRLTDAEVDWEKELVFFRESDINKPVLEGKYTSETLAGTETIKPVGIEGKVKKISIQRAGGEIQSVSIFYLDSNYLYDIRRELVMELKGGMLSAYSVSAKKKILMQDDFDLKVEGKLACAQ